MSASPATTLRTWLRGSCSEVREPRLRGAVPRLSGFRTDAGASWLDSSNDYATSTILAVYKGEEVLGDFGRIRAPEADAAKRRRPLAMPFDRVWPDGGTIAAVKPREALLRYFQRADELARRRERTRCQKWERRDSNPRFTPAIR
jgi:hypothetical protein